MKPTLSLHNGTHIHAYTHAYTHANIRTNTHASIRTDMCTLLHRALPLYHFLLFWEALFPLFGWFSRLVVTWRPAAWNKWAPLSTLSFLLAICTLYTHIHIHTYAHTKTYIHPFAPPPPTHPHTPTHTHTHTHTQTHANCWVYKIHRPLNVGFNILMCLKQPQNCCSHTTLLHRPTPNRVQAYTCTGTYTCTCTGIGTYTYTYTCTCTCTYRPTCCCTQAYT